jgi:AcrR family transcriptional regulator
MPRPKKTEQEIAAMRERILNAAMALLEKEGIAGLSIRKIGKQIGVSHMVLYTYFKNRSAIVEALKERWLGRLRAQREQDWHEAETGDALAVLRASLAQFGRFAHEHPQLYRLAWVHRGADVPARDRSQYMEDEIDHLVRLIALCSERGQCADRDPNLAATMALCIVNSPHILYHNEQFTGQRLYGQLGHEAVEAAMDYLTGPQGENG